MPFLYRIRTDGSAIDRWEIGCMPLLIGRGDEADVHIDDPRLSRVHFGIEREGDGFVIHDLHSKNGTWVRGHRISWLHLQPNDRIWAGHTWFLFEAGLTTAMHNLEAHQGHATEVIA